MIRNELWLYEKLKIHHLSLWTEKTFTAFTLFFLLFTACLGNFAYATPELEWKETRELKLENSPLDVVLSEDGQWTFILSPGKVMVYQSSNDKVSQTIPVEKSFDRLSFASKSKQLILTSSSQNIAQIIQLDVVQQIDVSESPFKGNKNAPVIIAYFTDYQ